MKCFTFSLTWVCKDYKLKKKLHASLKMFCVALCDVKCDVFYAYCVCSKACFIRNNNGNRPKILIIFLRNNFRI